MKETMNITRINITISNIHCNNLKKGPEYLAILKKRQCGAETNIANVKY